MRKVTRQERQALRGGFWAGTVAAGFLGTGFWLTNAGMPWLGLIVGGVGLLITFLVQATKIWEQEDDDDDHKEG